jgi:beta-lactamase class A
MLAILQRQQINDRLPKYLPKGVLTAHKTGELDGYKHDGGIIYAKNGPYILVILSKSENEQYAAETIALISKAIYEVREKNTQ